MSRIDIKYRKYKLFVYCLCMVLNGVIASLLVAVTACGKSTDIVNTGHQKYTYTEMLNDIEVIKDQYPEYVSVNVIGKTV